MRHTTAATLPAAVLATLAAGAILAPSGEAQEAPRIPVWTVSTVTKNFRYKIVDNPPRAKRRAAAPGPGDVVIINATTTSRRGKRTGSFTSVCDVTKGGADGRAICKAIWNLPEGQLHGMARVDLAGGAAVLGSIVGGTRRYEGYRGSFTSVDRQGDAGGDPSDDTFRLAR